MQRSEGRFLTTHVGSLPRSPQLLAMLVAKEQGANRRRGYLQTSYRA